MKHASLTHNSSGALAGAAATTALCCACFLAAALPFAPRVLGAATVDEVVDGMDEVVDELAVADQSAETILFALPALAFSSTMCPNRYRSSA